MVKVFIIGAGSGGKAVLSRLLQFNWIKIVGVADLNPEAPAIAMARSANLPIFLEDPFPLFHQLSIDLVFDLTGNPNVGINLLNFPEARFDVATGEVTRILWNVILELEEKESTLIKQLGDHQILLDISLMLSSSETPDQIFEAIVAGATRITGMPAGSLSVYNKEKKQLFLVASKGFSSEFYKNAVYPVRPGGLTEEILSGNQPILVPDISDFPAYNNPIILNEGIQALIALPLVSEKGPVGILYADDFEPRAFPYSLVESLRMLAAQAVIAIQKQQAFEKIKELSIRDPLTGLYNRHYFDKVMVSEIGRASRIKSPLSVIMIDVDYFKRINDKFGHLVGDQVLQGLSRSFEAIIRPYDVLARFGGDELMILLSETDEAKALATAERLRRASTEAAHILPDDAPLTCSFGVCSIQEVNEFKLSPKQFIRYADEALYLAKRAGRNRVHLHKK